LCTPIHEPLFLLQPNFHQTTPAWPPSTGSGVRSVQGSVGCTQQPPASDVEHLARLPIQLHRNMGTSVEIGMNLTCMADRKRPTRLRHVHHIKPYRRPTVRKRGRLAQKQPPLVMLNPRDICVIRHGRVTTGATLPPNAPPPADSAQRRPQARAHHNSPPRWHNRH